jgi:hypothetical protein
MKKKLKKQALEALYKNNAEGGPTAGEELTADATSTETSTEATTEASTEATTETLAAEAATEELKAATEKVQELEAKVAKLEKDSAALVEATEAKDNLLAEMSGILADQLSLRRVALDLADVDTSEMSAETLIKEYKSVDKMFMASLPSGEVTPTAQDEKPEEVFKTIADTAAAEALGF